MEDFKSKNITSNEITKIDNKEKDKCVEVTKHMKEEMAIYIARPEQDIVNIIAQVHFMLKALRPEIIEYLIFIPKENYDIIEYMSTNHIDDIKIANLNVDLIPIFSSIKPSQVLFVVIKVRKSTLLSKTTIPKISSVPNFILFSFSFSPTKSQNFLAKSPFIYLYFIFPKHVSNFTTAFAKSLMQE